MNCRECTTFLVEYFDGALDDEVRIAFEFHLSRCANCVRYLDSYRETIVLEHAAFDEAATAPPDMPEDLVRAILDARHAAPRRME